MPKKAELVRVNAEVNAETYVSERSDDWTPIVPHQGGDCDSYATAKFQKLVELGWSVMDLRLATCWDETGAYHAVLLVDFDGETVVLDNRQPYPTPFNLLPYSWYLVQVAGTQDWQNFVTQ